MFRETMRDGTIREMPSVTWRNPTEKQVKLRFLREPPKQIDGTKMPNERYHPARMLDVVIPPRATMDLPIDVSEEIATTSCTSPDCTKGRHCKDATHPRVVVAGLAPMLLREGVDNPPPVAPALTEPEPAPRVHDLADLERRVLARVAKESGR